MTNTFSTALGAAAAALAIGLIGAPAAAADQVTTTTLGGPAALVDGGVTQVWTVSGLQPSSDVIPAQLQGRLWEATATDQAIVGDVQPVVSNFNARAKNGDTYRVLFGVATAQGVNPAPLAQGQHTPHGKLYFDVTGADPDSVVYDSLGTDLLLWVQPPPAAGSGGSGSSQALPAGTEPPALDGLAAAEAVPGATSQGTPIVEGGSEGIPLVPLVEGTTTTPPAQSTPVVPLVEGTPSQGTPLVPLVEGTPSQGAAPAGTGADVTPQPAAGTPVTPTPAPTSAPPAAG
ncbi:MAG: MPT63 family protein [Actinomycetia bacterium]|nr:MPT63 family protein [Actinomycetes bacterium]